MSACFFPTTNTFIKYIPQGWPGWPRVPPPRLTILFFYPTSSNLGKEIIEYTASIDF